MPQNKLVVYTALFGNYDDLIEPKEKFEGCDFVCFTDQKHLTSDIWEIRLIEESDLPPNMMNRKYKILPHLFLSEYEWSLYVDANILIKKNPNILANKYLNDYDIAIPKHFARDCIYKESIEVVKAKKAKEEDVLMQVGIYRSNNFPKNYGLTENNIIFRNHNNKNIIELMKQWWSELNLFTKRDQLSLMYLIWKNNNNLKLMNENARGGEYFRIKLHRIEIQNRCKLYTYFLELFHNHPKLHKIPYFLSLVKYICKVKV